MFTFLLYSYISPCICIACCCVLGLQTFKYDQSLRVMETYISTSFMLMYGFLFELWVLNLNKEEKKMKNSAHHSPCI